MREAIAIGGLIFLSLLAGCKWERPPGPPVPLKSFVLHNVQGFFGGHAIWVAEDKTAIVQIVSPAPSGQSGLQEKRYKTKLTDAQWTEVERLVGAHHLLTTTVPDRAAVPDEGRPTIVLVTRAGPTTKVRKWANDKHPDFDPVYAYLLELCRAHGEPVREGAFHWEWRPDGFEQPW